MWAIEKPQVSKTARPGAPGNGGPTFIRLDGKTPGLENRETWGTRIFWALCVELTDRSE